jgi:hypothetical protein
MEMQRSVQHPNGVPIGIGGPRLIRQFLTDNEKEVPLPEAHPMDFDEAFGAIHSGCAVSTGDGRMQRPLSDETMRAATRLMTVAAGGPEGDRRPLLRAGGFDPDSSGDRMSRVNGRHRSSPP